MPTGEAFLVYGDRRAIDPRPMVTSFAARSPALAIMRIEMRVTDTTLACQYAGACWIPLFAWLAF